MDSAEVKHPFRLEQWLEQLQALAAETELVVDHRGRGFVPRDPDAAFVRLVPPPLLAIPTGIETARAYLAAPPVVPQKILVLLVQAGATSMGYWDGESLLAHKVIKKYVTRGNGRAQTTYLKTRGKSRYGSRLRLQNAKAQLVETNERLISWWSDFGPAEKIFYSCPTRTWPELFAATPPPPFTRDQACIKVPMDVDQPGHDELLKVRRFLAWGAVYTSGR